MEALSSRASSLLKTLVEMHIREGQPVASKNLQGESGLSVSPATVRNIMSELEDLGYLASPHTSAGRVPTAQGYRFFVDSLLQVGPVEQGTVSALNAGLDPNRSSEQLVQTASNLLAQITYQTGIVTVPRPAASQLRQIEFLPLSGDRVLAILVINEREVQNRIIQMQRPMTEEQITDMFGSDIPLETFKVHDWRNDVVTVGEVPAAMVRAASDGHEGCVRLLLELSLIHI